jgi:hypothetical protein
MQGRAQKQQHVPDVMAANATDLVSTVSCRQILKLFAPASRIVGDYHQMSTWTEMAIDHALRRKEPL